jgi:hypothetical protein
MQCDVVAGDLEPGCSWRRSRLYPVVRRSPNAQLNAVTELQRTDLNAIMTARQCGGQGSSPLSATPFTRVFFSSPISG